MSRGEEEDVSTTWVEDRALIPSMSIEKIIANGEAWRERRKQILTTLWEKWSGDVIPIVEDFAVEDDSPEDELLSEINQYVSDSRGLKRQAVPLFVDWVKKITIEEKGMIAAYLVFWWVRSSSSVRWSLESDNGMEKLQKWAFSTKFSALAIFITNRRNVSNEIRMLSTEISSLKRQREHPNSKYEWDYDYASGSIRDVELEENDSGDENDGGDENDSGDEEPEPKRHQPPASNTN
eukprot:c17927_g1_i1.p1 GENE.c17927_g1_i1~~c17927_g1_i1.p1  ORF type:complete len:236 (+),score=29.40 c17927_g1_i1:114-821(+)